MFSVQDKPDGFIRKEGQEVHIEISAGGLSGGIAVASFQSGMKKYISGTDGMISSFKAVRTKTYNLNGGVGTHLESAVNQVLARERTEEQRKSGAETVQAKSNSFLDLAIRVDKSVANMVKQDCKELYGQYPSLKASLWSDAKKWLSDVWKGLCGFAQTVADVTSFIADSIRKIKSSIGEVISNFMQEHKILGTIAIIGATVLGIFAFVAIIGALSIPTAVAGVLIAIFAVASAVGGGFNIAALWGALEGHPILQKIQATLNGITCTMLLIAWLGTGGSAFAIGYAVTSALLGITGIIDTWVTIDNPFYQFMQDTLEILSTVFGVLSFIEIIKGFIAKHRVSNYNSAGSKSVKDVKSVTRLDDAHSIPAHGEPNSVTQSYKNGNLVTERYYDNNGNPYLDIDNTSFQDLRGLERIKRQRFQEVKEAGSIFAEFGTLR